MRVDVVSDHMEKECACVRTCEVGSRARVSQRAGRRRAQRET